MTINGNELVTPSTFTKAMNLFVVAANYLSTKTKDELRAPYDVFRANSMQDYMELLSDIPFENSLNE